SMSSSPENSRHLNGWIWIRLRFMWKGGGVKVVRTDAELEEAARRIMGMQLVTHQTGPQGQTVRRLLVEEGADIRQELYLGMVVDRNTQQVALMGSAAGGMDIEEVAAHHPEQIHTVQIDPGQGLLPAQAEALARRIAVPEALVPQARDLMLGLYRAFVDSDASLAEINPMAVTGDGRILALDAKFNFDDNAAFRHGEWQDWRDFDEEDPNEIAASRHGLSYISLEGNIGCLVNGAGLAMATMDIVKLYGGSPANFLDVGGGATTEKVTEAFKLMLSNPEVQAILVNIFGGIMKCDVIAEGVVAAARQVHLTVPLVVRLEGTNVELGKRILAESGLPILSASNMDDAAAQVVAAARR
ncbi:ADP-forming succinate--CoA ligase subunit beta, partial [Ferrovum sp.]|uniref:ADP-forming succinate--CoA ligase subunit beta n=1 Tax=Ferrovum sp. TaxID=2609467 RepID=UPI0026017A7B